jgi:hypothetical protein
MRRCASFQSFDAFRRSKFNTGDVNNEKYVQKNRIHKKTRHEAGF